jgi:hypothetical protein
MLISWLQVRQGNLLTLWWINTVFAVRTRFKSSGYDSQSIIGSPLRKAIAFFSC